MLWGFLEDVDARVRADVENQCVVKKFRKDQVVFSQGDVAEALYIVQSGRFEAEVGTSDGNVMVARIHGPSSHFGEITMLDSRLGRTATIRALEPSSVFVIPKPHFEELRRRDPVVDRALIRSLTEFVIKLTEESADNAFLSAERRLAKRLLALAEIYSPIPLSKATSVSIPVTQEHLAMATGSTRPTVNRLLGELEGKAIITRSRNLITVCDLRGLQNLSW
jgi:CRP/FNR family transcriptional regulator, cyclic AMP receptor protein